jgi:hypothetical protein
MTTMAKRTHNEYLIKEGIDTTVNNTYIEKTEIIARKFALTSSFPNLIASPELDNDRPSNKNEYKITKIEYISKRPSVSF